MQDNKASRIFLVVAIVLGVLATLIAFSFIRSTEGQDRGPTGWIVVAKHDLKPNVDIDPDRDLKKEEIPKKFSDLFDNTLDPNALSNYKGQKLNRGIHADLPVYLADFAAAPEVGLPPPGFVYQTINAIPGVIVPGNYVKVMTVSGEILAHDQAFRVIAVGGQTRIAHPLTWSDQPSASNSVKSITLELTETQASELAKGMGTAADRIQLLLSPPPAPATRAVP